MKRENYKEEKRHNIETIMNFYEREILDYFGIVSPVGVGFILRLIYFLPNSIKCETGIIPWHESYHLVSVTELARNEPAPKRPSLSGCEASCPTRSRCRTSVSKRIFLDLLVRFFFFRAQNGARLGKRPL